MISNTEEQMVSLKDRRHSGRYTPRATGSPKELIAADLFIKEEYSDWDNYRDSFRDWFKDFKLIKCIPFKYAHYLNNSYWEKRDLMNKKQELLLKRRKAKQWRKNKMSITIHIPKGGQSPDLNKEKNSARNIQDKNNREQTLKGLRAISNFI